MSSNGIEQYNAQTMAHINEHISSGMANINAEQSRPASPQYCVIRSANQVLVAVTVANNTDSPPVFGPAGFRQCIEFINQHFLHDVVAKYQEDINDEKQEEISPER